MFHNGVIRQSRQQTAELGTDMQGQTGRDRESQVSLLHPYSQCTVVPLPPTVQYVCRYMYYNQQYQERLVVSTYTCIHTGLPYIPTRPATVTRRRPPNCP